MAGGGGLDSLRRRIGGTVTGRDGAGYEKARSAAVWNELKPERRPAVIVQASNARDVVEAVRFARQQGLRIAVRSGGHHMFGTTLREGSILVDVSRLSEIDIDAPSRTALVQPGVIGSDLARNLAAEGLAFPIGHCSSVALGGYLTGGGFGWNSGAWGPACFSVSGIDVVTADGELRTMDEHDADLLWAARGAGPGFFGVITRFRLSLQPLPPAIDVSSFVFPLDAAAQVAGWVSEAAAELPPSVELILRLAHDDQASDRERRGWTCAVVATSFGDGEGEAASVLAPLQREVPSSEWLSVSLHAPASFPSLFAGMDAHFPARHRYLAEAMWSDAEPWELAGELSRCIAAAPSAKSLILCPILPPPSADAPPPPDVAFSMTARSFALGYAVWDDPEQDEANRTWHRGLVDALAPRTVGYYIGESRAAVDSVLAERAFSPAAWRRLAQLRRKYDPDGLFCGFSDS
jgi:FAD/FMN-containing dehydrogenase